MPHGKWSKTMTMLCGAALGAAACEGGAQVAPSETFAQMGALTARPACATDPGHEPLMELPPPPEALAQIASLIKSRNFRDAARLSVMVNTPQAYWFTGGTPTEVEAAVHDVMVTAKHQHKVPILIAYNVPYRDCAQYSFGGATDTASYDAWIDAVARGIGDQKVILVLEPDGLGIIPHNTDLMGTQEWCRPTATNAAGQSVPAPGANPEERYAQLNYAVDSLRRQAPSALVYLDGTHSGWLSVGDAAARLVKAGVLRARGFFLNVSNFQPTPQLVQYGAWISKCIHYANNASEGGWRLGHYDYCASQYYPATVDDTSTWALTDQWYADNVDNAAAPPDDSRALLHYAIDTGRNGRGPMDASIYAQPPYNQPPEVVSALDAGNWCNPVTAGAGLRPTTRTGIPLVDAYVWANDPGISDGTCDTTGGARAWRFDLYNPWNVPSAAQPTFDPLWGKVNPFAGLWFPELALQLARNAVPALIP
jgi:endoglucanase